jgi:hypothetical protein
VPARHIVSRVVSCVTLALLMVAVWATPVLATTEVEVPEPDAQRPWHYWIAYALIAGVALFVVVQAVVFWLKVVRGPRR